VNPEFDMFLVLELAAEPVAVSFRYSQLGLEAKDGHLKAAASLEGWNDQKVFVASAPYADSVGRDAGAVLFFNRTGKTFARIDGVTPGEQLGIDMDVRGNEVVVASTRRIVRMDRGQLTFDMDLEESATAQQGIQVAFTQDIDGDRKPEILLGLPHADSGKLSEAGQIRVVGSRQGKVIDVIYGQKSGQHLGQVLQPITLQ